MNNNLEKILETSGVSDDKIFRALNDIEKLILQTRYEISTDNLSKIKSSAIDELDTVILATESATNKILNAAEVIEKLASWTDSSTGAELTAAVTEIYEACNFQDLSGQHIAKVIKSFHEIEKRIQMIMELTGQDSLLNKANMQEIIDKSYFDDKIMSGPQKPGLAKQQHEIDKILNEI